MVSYKSLLSTDPADGYAKSLGDVFWLKIPNQEIRNIFTKQIYSWFQETAEEDGATLSAFCDAFKNGDAEKVERQFDAYLAKTISIRDTFVRKKENFYHGILLGLLAYKENWSVSSNNESGEGYSDILIEIDDEETGIVIEVKYSDSENMLKCCETALNQINRMNYEASLIKVAAQMKTLNAACRPVKYAIDGERRTWRRFRTLFIPESHRRILGRESRMPLSGLTGVVSFSPYKYE